MTSDTKLVRRRGGALLAAIAVVASLVLGAAPAQADFPDVPPGTYYTEAVEWLERAGLTNGVGSTGLFQPGRVVTRAEAATFLWRLEGRPPAPPSGFSDVPSDAYFARPVAWLRDEGLTTGVGGTNRFAPHAAVTRAELATLLWRHADRPPGGALPFPDVVPGSFYDRAVRWMAGERLTTGVGCTGLFQPNGWLSRAELATFLHRYAGWADLRPGGFDPPPGSRCAPDISVTPVLSGLRHVWGIDFAPDGTMVLTERPGRISVRLPNGTFRALNADLGDVRDEGETGLMGLAVDPNFASNRRIYTCMGHTSGDVRVHAWQIDNGWTTAARASTLVSGIDGASSGRHGGCQLRFAPDGALLIGTGDAARGTNPQDLTALAGKVLRVDPLLGTGLPDNPFADDGNANTRRILTYGHRNVQGLAVRASDGALFAVEHGPTRDDEINILRSGHDYGWNPVPGYDEGVPMTAPGATPAVWSSGSTTIATSGADFLRGGAWDAWTGRLAVTTLKDETLRLFAFAPDGRFLDQYVVPELDGTYGRLRAVTMGPDGSLYVGTSNGGNDRVLRITPG